MTDAELREIEERAAKACPAPWTIVSSLPTYAIAGEYGTDVVTATGREYRQWHAGRHGCMKDNATFIAHARQDVPALCAEVRRLTEVLQAVADTSIDFMPTDYPYRRQIMKARAALEGK